MNTALIILALIILVGCSAFFSSSETAFLSISKIRLRQMLKEKKPKAEIIAHLKDKMDILLTTLLIGNNFINSLASSVATALAITIIGEKGTGVATLIMTIIIIIFGEILPKTIASYRSEEVAGYFANILNFLQKVLFPLVWIFTKFTRFIYWISGKISPGNMTQITEDELKTLFDLGGQEGTLELGEKDMLHKIFEFSDLRARDIQCPRALVKMIDCMATYEQTVAAISEFGFSRLPIYEETPENIVGMIHFKDILFYAGIKKDFSLKNLMHKVLFVPETKHAVEILQLFKTEKKSFAIIIGEHGSTSGIVTMDDLLKAVFGNIIDEHNTKIRPAHERITTVSPTEFVIPGDIDIADINSLFDWELASENSDTIAGWLLEQFGHLPEEKEILKYGATVYTVEKQKNRRIESIRLQFIQEKPKT